MPSNSMHDGATETALIKVEVAYALPGCQRIIPVTLNQNATVESAIMASGILHEFPEIDLSRNKIGIFGKIRDLNTVLYEKDRVEIYRPLLADPKEVRRQRAAETASKRNRLPKELPPK